ncbi:MAG: 50S ribosomal protein L11 methyltransferase [Rikenellaceae bacterium]
MNYIEYRVDVSEEGGDIIVALLCDYGFESFYYDGTAQCCYIQEGDYTEYRDSIEEALKESGYQYTSRLMPQENWNAEWESDFEPIEVEGRLYVRTPEHPKSSCAEEILITPNMSFGTGHHPTTYMMLRAMLDEDFTAKSLLDVGTGSGVLGIMAAMRGAATVEGVDIDSWAVESAKGNLILNGVQDKMTIEEGTVKIVSGKSYDYVLANIARNILIGDMQDYYNATNPGGKLFCSGFLAQDTEVLKQAATAAGYKLLAQNERNTWVMLSFQK